MARLENKSVDLRIDGCDAKEICNLLDLDSVVNLDQRVRVADAVAFKISHHGEHKTYQPFAISLRLFLNLFLAFLILFAHPNGFGEEDSTKAWSNG